MSIKLHLHRWMICANCAHGIVCIPRLFADCNKHDRLDSDANTHLAQERCQDFA